MRKFLILFNIAAFLAIAGAIAFQILADRERTIADATSDVTKLRDAMTEQTRQTFAAIEFALVGVAEDIDTNALGREETYRALKARQDWAQYSDRW